MTMLERMARQMCVRGWGRDDVSEVEWEAAAEYWMPVARAALVAIREPDLKMRQAATTFTGADIDWPAMIDAILEGKA